MPEKEFFESKQLIVIGLGTVGLTTALSFNRAGWKVIGVEQSKTRRNILLREHKHFREVELLDFLEESLQRGMLEIVEEIPADTRIAIVCVSVPIHYRSGRMVPNFFDLNSVISVLSDCQNLQLLSIETTIPIGTVDTKVLSAFYRDVMVVHAPERLAMGRLLWSVQHLPRVIAGSTPEAREYGVQLYKEISLHIQEMSSLRAAEAVKLVENTYRDVNIAFANEVARICDLWSIPVSEVRDAVNSLPSLSDQPWKNPIRNMHFPGSGVGGHCIPKDPELLLWSGAIQRKSVKYEPSIIRAARDVNLQRPYEIVEKVFQKFRRLGRRNGSVLLLGWAFAPDVVDDRETPARIIHDKLFPHYVLRVHDPYFMPGNLEVLLEEADVVVLVTPHQVYREQPWFDKIKDAWVVLKEELL